MHHLRYVLGGYPTTDSIRHQEAGIFTPHFVVSSPSVNFTQNRQQNDDPFRAELSFYEPDFIVLEEICVQRKIVNPVLDRPGQYIASSRREGSCTNRC